MDKTEMPPQKENAAEKSDDESVEFDASSLIIVPVNDDSKKIRQIFSNETSMKILEILKQESMSSSELADRLNIPLTTVKYNLDILVDNDLVNIKRIKYSEKGRQVKIYEAPEKVIVFAPEKMSRFSLVAMLQKYAFAFAGAGLLCLLLNSLYQRYAPPKVEPFRGMGINMIEESPVMETAAADTGGAAPTLLSISDSFSDWVFQMLAHHYVWFILGALFTCALIWMIEYVTAKREN